MTAFPDCLGLTNPIPCRASYNGAVQTQIEPVSDQALVMRMVQGDEAAVQALVDRHGRTVHALAHSILRDAADAEEIAADTFHQAWRTASSFDPARASVSAWLVMMARSRCLDRLRSRGRGQGALLRSAEPVEKLETVFVTRIEDSPEFGVEASEASRLVRCALEELSEPQRQVIELAYFGGLSQSEIAARLGVPLGTVKTRTLLGMKRLRSVLAPLLREEEVA